MYKFEWFGEPQLPESVRYIIFDKETADETKDEIYENNENESDTDVNV